MGSPSNAPAANAPENRTELSAASDSSRQYELIVSSSSQLGRGVASVYVCVWVTGFLFG